MLTTGFKLIPFETVLNPSLKGLEDEASIVQYAYCDTVASLFMEQIHLHVDKMEQSKVSSARGSSSGDSNDQVSCALVIKLMTRVDGDVYLMN